MIFTYPHREERRHAPAGYADLESYRPWLRDEFDFRCAYCLKRETWGQVTAEFDIDHFEPQAVNPQLKLKYANLVYACRRCNAVKRDQKIADPFLVLVAAHISITPDGSLLATDGDMNARRVIRQLDLNSPRLKEWRVQWLKIVALAKDHDQDLYVRLIGFPSDLPNLRRLRPPRNERSESHQESWFARRQRGFLPVEY